MTEFFLESRINNLKQINSAFKGYQVLLYSFVPTEIKCPSDKPDLYKPLTVTKKPQASISNLASGYLHCFIVRLNMSDGYYGENSDIYEQGKIIFVLFCS
ncbi:hypothetical protein DPMN_031565 [Dreissena polymorpha]|uniref:Uncharacterized protein n=1 Tax=Dreissena polymorpha TaxID=45954 RepID=A0A9D4M1A1_DREPO|nr:hypothetical protein DPMN_031565 [Dreissena polymorpha]